MRLLSSDKEERATLPSWWVQRNLSYLSLDLPTYRPEAKSCVSWGHFWNKLHPVKKWGKREAEEREKRENAMKNILLSE